MTPGAANGAPPGGIFHRAAAGPRGAKRANVAAGAPAVPAHGLHIQAE